MKTESQNTFTDRAKQCTQLAGRKKKGSKNGRVCLGGNGLIGRWKRGRKKVSKEDSEDKCAGVRMEGKEERKEGVERGRKDGRKIEGGRNEGRKEERRKGRMEGKEGG